MSESLTEQAKTRPVDNKDEPIKMRHISFDGLMKERDVEIVTGLSRVTIWRLEREGKFPARVQVSQSRVGWHGHEIKAWIDSRPRVNLAESETGETVTV